MAAPRSKTYSEIEEMMFGFGDEWPPNSSSVQLIELLVTQYIEDLTARAMAVSKLRGSSKLETEAFMFVVRKDQKKFTRINNLLRANEELKKAKRMTDIEDEVLTAQASKK